jgi:ABC-type branched-subunit amino acid transport system substrate-binding protein
VREVDVASRQGRSLLLGVAVLLLLPVAACGGSELSPAYVRAANEGVAAQTGTGPTTGGTGGTGGSATSDAGTATADGKVIRTVPDAGSSRAIASGPIGSGRGHGPAAGTGAHAAGGSHRAVSCTGFRDQTGVTDSTVVLANVADVSGPVPGIFTSAQQAAKAYVAYFNATSSLCGRKLELLQLDSRTDAGADQTAYTKACQEAFAAVGSMSAFDSGGAATAADCGLPDVRALSTSDARNACRTCFSAQATDLNAFQNAVPDYFLTHHRQATQHAAMVYVNAAASVQNAKTQQAVEEKRGMRFVYSAAFDVAEFNYTPYVERMKDKGVRWVQFVGSTDQAVRLAQAMQSAKFAPEVFLLDPTSYNPTFVRTGGSAVDGAFVFIDFTPFEEARHSTEMQLYEAWLQQVAPGSVPTYFGLFAWSATRLFVEQAAALGGRLTRAGVVSRIRGVHGWTSNGLHAAQDVGGKTNSSCWRFLRLVDGHWRPAGGYLCHGSTKLR